MHGCRWTALILLCCGFLYSCASLPLDLNVPYTPLENRSVVIGEYRDYRGVIHCHSSFSHDSDGQLTDIVAAAQDTHLDFVVMTDHITPSALTHGLKGWQGQTLFVLGAEISKANGSILGVGVQRFVQRREKTAQEVIDALQAQGALSVIAYPERFRDWHISGYDGVEIYNLKSDLLEEYRISLVLSALFLPPRVAFSAAIDRPKKTLALWDRLSQTRRVVGVAGTNAHNNVRFLGRNFDTYHQLFQLFTNHILAPCLTEEALLSALKAGHVYVAFDLFGYVPHFVFSAESNGQQVIMGDTIALSPTLSGTVKLPREADIRILKDGRLWKRKKAQAFHFPIAQVGVYRVEVYKQGKPWILSNPIYVVAQVS